jgi:hypothetical protein
MGTTREAGDVTRVGNARCTAQKDFTTDTTLAAITGMRINVVARRTYVVRAHVYCVSTANGGAKFGIAGGTATATAIRGNRQAYNAGTLVSAAAFTSLTTLLADTAVYTDVVLDFTITVNAGGTLIFQGAQNASHGETTSFYVGSWMLAEEVP